MGNGAADIFSATAATMASQDGGELAVAGVIGGGLFVVTVVSGTIAVNIETKVEFSTIGRDILFYLIAVGFLCYILFDEKVEMWECALFVCLYILYVGYVVVGEKKGWFESAPQEDSEGLLQDLFLVDETTPISGKGSSVMPAYVEPFAVDEHGMASPGALMLGERSSPWALRRRGTPGEWIRTMSMLDLLRDEESKWSEKSFVAKCVLILQLPVRLLLSITAPVVYAGEPERAWDRVCFLVTTPQSFITSNFCRLLCLTLFRKFCVAHTITVGTDVRIHFA